MEFFPDIETVLSLGSIRITWYAVFILTGAILAYILSLRTLKKWGYDTALFEDFFFYMLPVGIIGARIYYVIFEWSSRYAADPISAFFIWEGGLAIHGGIIAATLFGLWYFHKRPVDGLRIMDAIFPHVLLSQALGRWGNFMNQEAFGGVVQESFYTHFPSFIKDQMYINGQYRQPTFLFESVANLIGWVVINFVYKKYGRRKRGDLAFAYFSWYGVVRFWIESMRTDALMVGDIRVAQVISLLAVVFGVLGILGVGDKVFKNIWPFKRKKPVVLFDLDGTLVDTKELIFASFQHTFEKYKSDYTLSQEELYSFMGPTLKDTFLKYFKEDEVDEIIAYYREYNIKHHDELVKEFPGTKDMLNYLKKNDYALGIVSNKVEATVRMGLEKCGLSEYFEVIVGAEDVKEPKPSPQGILLACEKLYHGHDDVIYVGDSASDIKACKAMAAFSIGAQLDSESKLDLTKEHPCVIIHALSEIVDIVKEDREWSDVTI